VRCDAMTKRAPWWVGVAVAALFVGCAGSPGVASSGSSCAEPVTAWADQCASRSGLEIRAVTCPEGALALVDVGPDPSLRVELRRGGDQSFRREGAWGLSPVGDFPDWRVVDPRVRDRFERLRSCVRADEGFAPGLGAPGRRAQARAPVSARSIAEGVPWMLLLAAGFVIAAMRGRWSAAWRLRAALGAGMALGVFALRALSLPARFFHQNGQGPLWVASVVAPQPPHPYGPGYRALFGCVRWFAHDPDRGVFFVQGLLASASVPCAAFVARRMGAGRPLAFALAFAVAVDPILGRLSRSESYYGVGASLLFLASALLASSLSALRVRSAGFLLPVLAASLVIAQHALVHPIGWLAASLSPAVLLLGPGHWRRRVRRTLAATLVIAVVVAVVAAPSMIAVLRSPFGAQWMGHNPQGFQGFAGFRRIGQMAPAALAVAALAAAGTRSWRRGALLALVLVVSFVALIVADLVGFGLCTPWVHQAYLRLYAPVALLLAVAALHRVTARRPGRLAVAVGVALLAVTVSWRMWPTWTKLPTDVQEQELARRWRGGVPASARIGYVERVGRRVLMLPFYNGASVGGPEPVILRLGEFSEDLARVGRETFYERTSLCSTREGRPFCAQLEGRYRLVPVHEAELPAAPSMVGLGYDAPTVRVGLYRVMGPSAPAP
jgi:hypothetical protein